MSGDSYRIVTARFRNVSASGKAIFIEKPHARGALSVPRSLLHGADDLAVDTWKDGEEVTFRLRVWKAEALGLA